MARDGPWFKALWHMVDGTLRGLSKGLKRFVRTLRILRFFLIIAILTVLASAVVAIGWPQYWPYLYAASAVFLAIPLLILLVLVALPLRAKSVVRLIDLGYPDNAKELAIRVAARKLHDQSIESEAMILETAWNESKKMLRKYRARAERLKRELDADDERMEEQE